MFGKSVYSVHLEKYGKEEADRKEIIRKEKAIETRNKATKVR